MNKLLPLLAFSLLASGCSMFPYENSSSCTMDKQYGKCIDVEGAYDEAVTGVDSGAPKMYKVSEGKPEETEDESKVSKSSSKDAVKVSEEAPQASYRNYQSQRYSVLSELIKEPVAPMLSAPKTVRTLIISYSPEVNDKTLYMPRYVYSIVEDSKFVLGQYLDKRNSTLDIFEAN